MPSAARGSTPASFSLLSAAAGCPRRSILENTRPVYGAGGEAGAVIAQPAPGTSVTRGRARGHRPGGRAAGAGRAAAAAGACGSRAWGEAVTAEVATGRA